MYKTLDGDLTCEACTRNQCDGEIPDGAAWVDGGECYLCEHCHDDPAGCGECPHCPDCGDPMRDHEGGECPV